MKKVLILSTSLRNNSNSEILARELEKGALEVGHSVEFISLKDKTINFCNACSACFKLGKCVLKDDANAIIVKMKDADVIVWATPIYFYEMSGQMKTLIDRAVSLYHLGKKFSETYVITTSTDDTKGVSKTVLNGVHGWLSCFDNVTLKGCLEASGLEQPNAVLNRNDLLEQAYNMGKNL